ncbi:MAG: hypothetical protein GDA56_05915 [Hormoscilla sp. GM7CHS1pb]|nr:hypothetical protein [Hormoscilla sp. GM7CHS1pb]
MTRMRTTWVSVSGNEMLTDNPDKLTLQWLRWCRRKMKIRSQAEPGNEGIGSMFCYNVRGNTGAIGRTQIELNLKYPQSFWKNTQD